MIPALRSPFVIASLAALLGLGLLGGVGEEADAQRSAIEPLPRSTAPPAGLTPDELANIRVYDAANRSVVNISTSTIQRDRMFGLTVEGEGAGSGAILDRDGHILTNLHVIENAREVRVTLANDNQYDAVLVGADQVYDMAVLRIDAPPAELTPIRLGRSDNLRVGQKAYALGNPFGLDGTLSCGVVSSLNRSLPSQSEGRVMTGMIQTDAAMNPGNSGGPLLNTSAEMFGMCVAIRSSVGQNSGVGFAIPIDRIRRFVPELIENGRVVRAEHGIEVFYETPSGLRIAKLRPGGPAELAGLRAFRVIEDIERRGNVLYRTRTIDREHADYVVEVDGKPVSTTSEFLAILDAYKPGDRAVFTVLRQGANARVVVTLGAS